MRGLATGPDCGGPGGDTALTGRSARGPPGCVQPPATSPLPPAPPGGAGVASELALPGRSCRALGRGRPCTSAPRGLPVASLSLQLASPTLPGLCRAAGACPSPARHAWPRREGGHLARPRAQSGSTVLRLPRPGGGLGGREHQAPGGPGTQDSAEPGPHPRPCADTSRRPAAHRRRSWAGAGTPRRPPILRGTSGRVSTPVLTQCNYTDYNLA